MRHVAASIPLMACAAVDRKISVIFWLQTCRGWWWGEEAESRLGSVRRLWTYVRSSCWETFWQYVNSSNTPIIARIHQLSISQIQRLQPHKSFNNSSVIANIVWNIPANLQKQLRCSASSKQCELQLDFRLLWLFCRLLQESAILGSFWIYIFHLCKS